MHEEVAISCQNLAKAYTISSSHRSESTLAETLLNRLKRANSKTKLETFWALQDVNFELCKGDVVGVIGRNGAGKSTLLKILSRITHPTKGRVELFGRVGSLLEVGTGFHPELSGRENIYLNGNILGMSRAEIRQQYDAIVDFSGVEKFLETPVKRYSSGMYVRLAFAVAAHLQSEILIVDEVLAVGDAEFQRKCLGKMKDAATSGRTVLFVSHHMQSVQVLCNRGMYLERGRVTHFGSVSSAIDKYVESFARAKLLVEDPDRRPGTGEFRFVQVTPSKETFTCGEEKNIHFRIERRKPFAGKLFVSAHIVNEVGVMVAQCDSRMVGRWFDDADQFSGIFSFRTPWLKPGMYRVEMFICSSGVLDRFDEAARLEVIPLLPYAAAGNDEATAEGVVFGDFDYTQSDAEALV